MRPPEEGTGPAPDSPAGPSKAGAASSAEAPPPSQTLRPPPPHHELLQNAVLPSQPFALPSATRALHQLGSDYSLSSLQRFGAAPAKQRRLNMSSCFSPFAGSVTQLQRQWSRNRSGTRLLAGWEQIHAPCVRIHAADGFASFSREHDDERNANHPSAPDRSMSSAPVETLAMRSLAGSPRRRANAAIALSRGGASNGRLRGTPTPAETGGGGGGGVSGCLRAFCIALLPRRARAGSGAATLHGLFFLGLLGVTAALIGFSSDRAIEHLLWWRAEVQRRLGGRGMSPSQGGVVPRFTAWIAHGLLLGCLSIWVTKHLSPAAVGSGIPEMKSILAGSSVSLTAPIFSIRHTPFAKSHSPHPIRKFPIFTPHFSHTIFSFVTRHDFVRLSGLPRPTFPFGPSWPNYSDWCSPSAPACPWERKAPLCTYPAVSSKPSSSCRASNPSAAPSRYGCKCSRWAALWAFRPPLVRPSEGCSFRSKSPPATLLFPSTGSASLRPSAEGFSPAFYSRGGRIRGRWGLGQCCMRTTSRRSPRSSLPT